MQIFRFIDPDTLAVRLDLNDPHGWLLGEGLDLGRKAVTKRWLSQEGVDGAEMAGSWHEIVQMPRVPLILMNQATAGDMETLIHQLNAELGRPQNCIEALPNGLDPASGTYYIDTYMADEVSSYDGEERRTPWLEKGAKLFVLQIDRKPDMRGRGTSF